MRESAAPEQIRAGRRVQTKPLLPDLYSKTNFAIFQVIVLIEG